MSASCPLPERWLTLAAELRALECDEPAAALEKAARELQDWLAAQDEQLLTLDEAAARAGRSRSAIEKALRAGRLPNQGIKHRPRVRAADVDRLFPKGTIGAVAPQNSSRYDPAADARFLSSKQRGG